MTNPEWLKPGAYGFVLGGIAVAVVGFTWGGWMTGGSAEEMAANRAKTEVTAALVPVCVEMSRTDPNRVEKIAVVKEASSFKRRDAVMETGWATMPGADAPDRNLAAACADGLNLDPS